MAEAFCEKADLPTVCCCVVLCAAKARLNGDIDMITIRIVHCGVDYVRSYPLAETSVSSAVALLIWAPTSGQPIAGRHALTRLLASSSSS